MQQLSEEEIISQTPFTVRLGDKDYQIPPLPILKARAWRKKLSEVVSPEILNREAPPEGADLNEWLKSSFKDGILLSLVRSPEKIVDLVFEYAPSLSREEILGSEENPGKATDAQFLLAFSAIMLRAFPFFSLLGMLKEMFAGTTANASPSPKPDFLN